MIDIDLGQIGQPKSQARTPPQILGTRALTKEALTASRAATAEVVLKDLRPSHRRVAELLAKGMRPLEVSIITGYSVNRISVLQNDPAFKELLSLEAARTEQVSEDLAAKVRQLSHDALAEMQARLSDQPEGFGTAALLNLLTATLDRSGVGPKSEKVHKHIHADAATLERIRARRQEQGRVIYGTTENTQSGRSDNPAADLRLSGGEGAEGGLVHQGRAVRELGPPEAQGHTGEGEDL